MRGRDVTDWKIGQRVDALRKQSAPLAKAVSDPKTRQWCAVQTNALAEKRAGLEIEALGYMVYVPRFTVSARDRTKHRKWVRQERAVFRGYVFAQADLHVDPWGDIERLKMVQHILRTGDTPNVVPPELIHGLRMRELDNFGISMGRVTPIGVVFKPGDPIRVVDGPFADFLGSLDKLDDKGRIVALLDLLGRQVRVSLDIDQVEKA